MDTRKSNILKNALMTIGVVLFTAFLGIFAVFAMYVGEYGFLFSAENLAKILN